MVARGSAVLGGGAVSGVCKQHGDYPTARCGPCVLAAIQELYDDAYRRLGEDIGSHQLGPDTVNEPMTKLPEDER